MYDQRADDKYEVPTSQVILLKGNQCIEAISIPSMQHYFTNVELQNREYAYFQVSHFDFPLNDSLTKTFNADMIDVEFQVIQYIATQDNQISTTFISNDILKFDLHRTHSSLDIANTLLNQIVPLGMWQQDRYQWLNWFASVQFETAVQKLSLTLTTPAAVRGYESATGYGQLRRIEFRLMGSHTGRQGELAAALFGGKVDDSGSGWTASFDTGYTSWFANARLRTESTTLDAFLQTNDEFIIRGQRPSRMFVDPYVYIRGAPEQSIWTKDGSASDLLTLQPRNRPAGVVTNQQAFLSNQTHSTKTALAALRSMTLQLTDSKGRLLLIDEDYVIKITIDFKQ